MVYKKKYIVEKSREYDFQTKKDWILYKNQKLKKDHNNH